MKVSPTSTGTKSSKAPPVTPAISYKLSNELFRTLGWTSQPDTATVVPMVTMKAKFARPVISPWFAARPQPSVKRYKNGRTLCVSKEDGTGRIYYPNGRVAIRVRKGGTRKQITRIVVNTPGGIGADGVRRPPQLCGVFDSLGRGVIYDCDKKKRLVYNQTEGIAWLKPGSRPIHWKWHNIAYSGSMSTLDDNDASPASKDAKKNVKAKDPSLVGSIWKEPGIESAPPKSVSAPSRASTNPTQSAWSSTEVRFQEAVEERHYVNTAHLMPFSAIKPLVVQINRYIAIRILTQSEIVLSFFAEGEQTRLNIGTLYNPHDKLAVEKVYISHTEKVMCPFEVLPSKTKSMERFKELVKHEKSNPCWNLA